MVAEALLFRQPRRLSYVNTLRAAWHRGELRRQCYTPYSRGAHALGSIEGLGLVAEATLFRQPRRLSYGTTLRAAWHRGELRRQCYTPYSRGAHALGSIEGLGLVAEATLFRQPGRLSYG